MGKSPVRSLTPRFGRPLAFAMSGFSWLLGGCTSSTTAIALAPYTGINIDSQSLVSGLGCGTAPGQVYRYLAEVDVAPEAGPPGADIPAIGVFDCYANGVFENLPLSEAGSYDYVVTIYAWDKASLPASLDCDGGPCVPPSADASAGLAPTARWTTTCTATQELGAVVFAVCSPLQLRPAEVGGDAGASADASANALE